jgi:cytochrome c
MTHSRRSNSATASCWRWLVLVSGPVATLFVFAIAPFASSPGQATDRIERGRSLLAENCGGCHALGKRGSSPLSAAPPFRSLGNRVDFDELFDRLQEGLSSAHHNMPAFRFSREDAHAIRSYLSSIQD